MTVPTPLTHHQIFERLNAAFPDAGLVLAEGTVPATVVSAEHLHAVSQFVRDDAALRFDYPASITAVDYMDYFELIYQLRSFVHGHDANIKCRIDREESVAPSVVDLWPGADFQEREIFDLMGVKFSGHPNLQRILLWDEFEGHPLRKDFGIPAPLPPDVELELRTGRWTGLSTESDAAPEDIGGDVPSKRPRGPRRIGARTAEE